MQSADRRRRGARASSFLDLLNRAALGIDQNLKHAAGAIDDAELVAKEAHVATGKIEALTCRNPADISLTWINRVPSSRIGHHRSKCGRQTGRVETKEKCMRKLLIVVGPLAGTGPLAAQASEDRTGLAQDGSLPFGQTETLRTDGERVRNPRDDRSYERGEGYREEHLATREDDDDETDSSW
jgi:hypothetical protein